MRHTHIFQRRKKERERKKERKEDISHQIRRDRWNINQSRKEKGGDGMRQRENCHINCRLPIPNRRRKTSVAVGAAKNRRGMKEGWDGKKERKSSLLLEIKTSSRSQMKNPPSSTSLYKRRTYVRLC